MNLIIKNFSSNHLASNFIKLLRSDRFAVNDVVEILYCDGLYSKLTKLGVARVMCKTAVMLEHITETQCLLHGNMSKDGFVNMELINNPSLKNHDLFYEYTFQYISKSFYQAPTNSLVKLNQLNNRYERLN